MHTAYPSPRNTAGANLVWSFPFREDAVEIAPDRMDLDWCNSLEIEADVARAGWRRRLKIWGKLELPAARVARRLA